MRHARLLVLLPALVALGCPGDWDEPLGSVHGGHLDQKLVGEWRCEDPADHTRFRLSMVPFDKDQYVLVLTDLADKKPATTCFRAFTTTVSGHDVMNLKALGDEPRDGGWNYARFHFPSEGQLQIDPVRREPLTDVPDDVESRRLAIGDLFDVPELWEDGYRCVPFKDEPAK
jgi:hypothetical protein